MSHCTKCLREKRYKIGFSSITSAWLIGFWHIDYQNLSLDVGQCLEVQNTKKWWNWLRNTWFFKTYSVTSKISKLFKMSVESNEVKGYFVPCQVNLNLLLFTVSFTIFLEIEFDFIFYVRYRSEEISPPRGLKMIAIQRKKNNGSTFITSLIPWNDWANQSIWTPNMQELTFGNK